MIQVCVISIEVDLSRFSQWLHSQGVQHRIVEEQGQQVLYLENEALKDKVLLALERYIDEPAVHDKLDEWVDVNSSRFKELNSRSSIRSLYLRASPSQAPIIFLLMIISLIVAFLSDFGHGGPFIRNFLILDPFTLNADLSSASGRWQGLMETLVAGEVWRIISPDFIHFSVMHITFNLLMLWVLGGQLEIQKGSLSFLALVIFVSIVSNIAQLLETSYLFGGMSGVVYGLVGYCWLWRYFQPGIFFPDVLLKFSLIWLVLGYTPLTEWLGLGKMANAAHLYGLIAGLLWGAITLLVNEKLGKKLNSSKLNL
ncbi:MAG: GlpG protein [Oleiphilaceae bacterium]|jgi:GlpG protein